MSQYKKSEIMKAVRHLRDVCPHLSEDLNALADQNRRVIGISGFDDADLAGLFAELPNQALVHRVLSTLGWTKRQVMVAGERGPLWVLRSKRSAHE